MHVTVYTFSTRTALALGFLPLFLGSDIPADDEWLSQNDDVVVVRRVS